MHLLILRPKASADNLKMVLENLGIELTHFPLSQQLALDCAFPTQTYSGLVFTSKIALQIFAEKLAQLPKEEQLHQYFDWPLYAVGDKTANLASNMGFQNVISANGDGEALAKQIISSHDVSHSDLTKPLLYPCAVERQFDLQAALNNSGIAIKIWEIYKTEYVQDLPLSLIKSLRQGHFDAIGHFSSRSAQHTFYLLEKHGLLNHIKTVRHFVLSKQIRHHIPASFEANVMIAEQPNENAFLDLMKKFI